MLTASAAQIITPKKTFIYGEGVMYNQKTYQIYYISALRQI